MSLATAHLQQATPDHLLATIEEEILEALGDQAYLYGNLESTLWQTTRFTRLRPVTKNWSRLHPIRQEKE